MYEVEERDKEKKRFQRTVSASITVLTLLALVYGIINPPENFLLLLVLSIIVVLSLVVVFSYVYFDYQDQKQIEVKNYLIDEMDGFYFYGFPLSWCLQAGVVRDLRRNKIGDFTVKVGSLMLTALSGIERDPVVFYAEQNDTDNGKYFAAVLRFYYAKNWWQIDLAERLDRQYVIKVRPKYEDYFYLNNCKPIVFWRLERHLRRIYKDCKDPKRSDLPADIWYTQSGDAKELVRRRIDHVLSIWQACREYKDRGEEQTSTII